MCFVRFTFERCWKNSEGGGAFPTRAAELRTRRRRSTIVCLFTVVSRESSSGSSINTWHVEINYQKLIICLFVIPQKKQKIVQLSTKVDVIRSNFFFGNPAVNTNVPSLKLLNSLLNWNKLTVTNVNNQFFEWMKSRISNSKKQLKCQPVITEELQFSRQN